MSDWSGGYVSDVDYLPGFYPGQAPAVMDLACIMGGYEPVLRPGSDRSFTYCDIGCGQGDTVAALAAANPQGRFWGIDLMPSHIARAEQFRREAGLDNLTLIEADVADLAAMADPGLPQFDYIALHGLFSWVSDEVRAGLVRFLDRFLRPGGAVYMGYNVLPGWTEMIPARKVLFEYAATRLGSSTDRVALAIEFLGRMVETGAGGVDNDMRRKLFADSEIPQMEARRRRYFAHEFLNAHWQPRFHIDVARELAAAKLELAGSAGLLENFAGIGLNEDQQALLQTLPPGPLRETIEDYFINRRFRRDVFVRGRRPISSEVREAMLADVALVMCAPRPAPDQRRWPMLSAEFSLNRDTYDPVFDRLQQGPARLAELCAAVRAAGGATTGNELVGLLSGLELVQPVLQDVTGAGVAGCLRHNRAVLEAAFRSSQESSYFLATPVGHTALGLGAVRALMVEALLDGVPAEVEPQCAHFLQRSGLDPDAEVALSELAKSELGIRDDPAAGSVRRIGDQLRAMVAAALVQDVPVWRQLAILPPPGNA